MGATALRGLIHYGGDVSPVWGFTMWRWDDLAIVLSPLCDFSMLVV